jgi:RNA polymerase sigma-70 factor (ECF subfamily)
MTVLDEGIILQENTLSDGEIIASILGGDRDAYTRIVDRFQDRVYGYCLATLADPVKAEDAAQEVFIKAYQALGRFRGDSSFFTWLYRIAINHCKDILRRTSRAKTESWEALLEKEGERIEALFAMPEMAGEAAEKMELISKILSCLPEKSRTLLLLREAQGLSYGELAEATKSSIDSVKSRLKRSRQEIEKKLRHLLRG